MQIVTPPKFTRILYPEALWEMPEAEEKTIYLTFDDGPQAEITEWVLDQLKEWNAQATFFCIGKNVEALPGLFRKVAQDHIIGNHSYSHLNSWQSKNKDFLKDVQKCRDVFSSRLFRPPYGKMKRKAYRKLKEDFKIVLWSVLSYDWLPEVTGEQCLQNVLKRTTNGSIVVFHDSQKAGPKLKKALPEFLKIYSDRGYRFSGLPTFEDHKK